MKLVDGVLLLYYHEPMEYAPTVLDHVRALANSPTINVWAVNTYDGFPKGLSRLRFRALIAHYSLSGSWPYLTASNEQDQRAFYEYVRDSVGTYKIAFFQDEYHGCAGRFRFIDECAVDCVYSLLDPKEVPKVYGRYTPHAEVRHTLTGYVPDDLIEKAQRWTNPPEQRRIDVGYRGRPLPYWTGRGAREKTAIADEFMRRMAGSDLVLDVKTAEEDRIYGDDWYRFIADCRAMLGVEAGTSIFDLTGEAQARCEAYLADHPDAGFEETHRAALAHFEDRVQYRTISPRIFEAAAFRVCQILFEGRYNDIIEPMVHYIPLKKDFSNLDEVLALLRDRDFVRRMTDRAYDDLIGSRHYSFRLLAHDVESHIRATLGAVPRVPETVRRIDRTLRADEWLRKGRRRLAAAKQDLWMRLHQPFPGKRQLKPLLGPIATLLLSPNRRDK